jgi:hypothetical protein
MNFRKRSAFLEVIRLIYLFSAPKQNLPVNWVSLIKAMLGLIFVFVCLSVDKGFSFWFDHRLGNFILTFTYVACVYIETRGILKDYTHNPVLRLFFLSTVCCTCCFAAMLIS